MQNKETLKYRFFKKLVEIFGLEKAEKIFIFFFRLK
jgi:hypothetical protein